MSLDKHCNYKTIAWVENENDIKKSFKYEKIIEKKQEKQNEERSKVPGELFKTFPVQVVCRCAQNEK